MPAVPRCATAKRMATDITEVADDSESATLLVSRSASENRYPRKTTSSRTGPRMSASRALFHPRSTPSGCVATPAIAITALPAARPQNAHAAVAFRVIDSQATNSRPRVLSCPVDETATTRKAQVSINPTNSRLGVGEPSAANGGRSNSQKSSSLQYTSLWGRRFLGVLTGSVPTGMPQFWRIHALVPKLKRNPGQLATAVLKRPPPNVSCQIVTV